MAWGSVWAALIDPAVPFTQYQHANGKRCRKRLLELIEASTTSRNKVCSNCSRSEDNANYHKIFHDQRDIFISQGMTGSVTIRRLHFNPMSKAYPPIINKGIWWGLKSRLVCFGAPTVIVASQVINRLVTWNCYRQLKHIGKHGASKISNKIF